jgi:hypothetical protein
MASHWIVREMETERLESIEGGKREARVGDMKISQAVLSMRAFMALAESAGQETERIKEEWDREERGASWETRAARSKTGVGKWLRGALIAPESLYHFLWWRWK